ncbi:CpaF family protein [Effusibacillus lacus]|uniref:Type II secretion system protein E n=1 Tax=Effusibacillus lacus TaxID=1348429 RepID=A0A292YI03_9BACL|nr:CpaF family protein [Effusibacillus lacus]TCS73631.1 pilus assembly protein CpaF [Effusibacillus lacus]GAX89478.1 type II secretion system protein E [Effusibacillus lacus]
MLDNLVSHYKNRLLQETELDRIQNLSERDMRLSIMKMIERFIQEEKVILSRSDKEHLIARILDDSVGFGPLEAFLHDESITEIMVNGPFEIFVERDGKLHLTDSAFRDDGHLRHVIDRMVAPVGRRVDEYSPMVDARLKDGSRVNAIIPPVSLRGPVLTIRKFRKQPFSITDLLQKGTMDSAMARFLEGAVQAKLNILLSGGTGSGKTTLLNVLSSYIPHGERVITIEDSAELRLQGQHVVNLETRPENVEGRGEITIRQLVRNALRMRPDRIIVGEVRGDEALDMLQAMNTGHEGSLTTIHANSPHDALGRLEAMVLMGGVSLPPGVIRQYILSAIDLIVQMERFMDGRRRVVSIAEVRSCREGLEIHELFAWERAGMGPEGNSLGQFRRSDKPPVCLERIKNNGIRLQDLWRHSTC